MISASTAIWLTVEDGSAITAALHVCTTDHCGCDSNITIQLTVNPLPELSAALKTATAYTVTSNNPTPDGGTGDLLNGNTLQHEGPIPAYEVSYSVTDGNGTNIDLVDTYSRRPSSRRSILKWSATNRTHQHRERPE